MEWCIHAKIVIFSVAFPRIDRNIEAQISCHIRLLRSKEKTALLLSSFPETGPHLQSGHHPVVGCLSLSQNLFPEQGIVFFRQKGKPKRKSKYKMLDATDQESLELKPTSRAGRALGAGAL